MTTEFVLKFAGVFFGVLARTLLPWLRKLRDGQVLKFDRRYIHAAAASLAIGFILTLVIFPQGPAPSGAGPGFRSLLQALLPGVRIRIRLERDRRRGRPVGAAG